MIELQTELKGTYEVIPGLESKVSSGLETAAQSFQVALKLPLTLSYFHGHFPFQPVLPAVGIVDISCHFIEEFISQTTSLKKISFFKMKAPIPPEQRHLIRIHREGPQKFHVVWENERTSSVSTEFFLEVHESLFS